MNSVHLWLAEESLWLWPRIADHLFQTLLFTVLILAATAALRKGPARVRHSLWVVASVKLLVPAAFLVALMERLGLNWELVFSGLIQSLRDALLFRSITEPVAVISNSYTLSAVAPGVSAHDEFYCAMTVIWFAGSLSLLLVWHARRQRFLRILKQGRKVNEGRAWDTFNRAKQTLGLDSQVELVLTRSRTEPTVARVWKPAVLLPESICEQMNDQELEAIMLHELVHVQRHDNLIGNVQMLFCALLWFYPPVWFISRQLINEREEACDEKVLQMGGVPEAYAASILKVLRFSFGWKVAGVSGAGNGSNLRRRIRNIMISTDRKRSTRTSRILAGLLVFIATSLMISAGVSTRAGNTEDAVSLNAPGSPTVYERVVSKLIPLGQKSTKRKPQPPTPPQPAQAPQPGQPAQPAPPSQPDQPAVPSQPTQPAPPAQPANSSLPPVPAPPAVPAPGKPVTPATAPAPPATPGRPARQDDKDGVEKGGLIEAPQPAYPDEARKQQIAGSVEVSIVIDEDGNVISARAISGPEPLRSAAVEAAFKARFRPTTVKGKPAKVSGNLSYTFVLDNC